MHLYSASFTNQLSIYYQSTIKSMKNARLFKKKFFQLEGDIMRVCGQDKWEGSDSRGRPYDVIFTCLARERHIEGKEYLSRKRIFTCTNLLAYLLSFSNIMYAVIIHILYSEKSTRMHIAIIFESFINVIFPFLDISN